MPLKLICKHCGAVMYETNGEFKQYVSKAKRSNHLDASVPDIVDLKLHFKCPSCKRTISSEDLESWTIKIKKAPKTKLM